MLTGGMSPSQTAYVVEYEIVQQLMREDGCHSVGQVWTIDVRDCIVIVYRTVS